MKCKDARCRDDTEKHRKVKSNGLAGLFPFWYLKTSRYVGVTSLGFVSYL